MCCGLTTGARSAGCDPIADAVGTGGGSKAAVVVGTVGIVLVVMEGISGAPAVVILAVDAVRGRESVEAGSAAAAMMDGLLTPTIGLGEPACELDVSDI